MNQTRYCTLYRLGYWCSLDAECRTAPLTEECDMEVIHTVMYVLINRAGERCIIGDLLVLGRTDCPEVDVCKQIFPDLRAAVRNYAAQLMRITLMPGRWTETPPRHETWQETVATAFDP